MPQNNLRQLREKKGWTQEELAEKLDVSDRTIRNWEAGGKISAVYLRQICNLFAVTEDKFFSLPEDKAAQRQAKPEEREEKVPPPQQPFYLRPIVLFVLAILLIAALLGLFVLYKMQKSETFTFSLKKGITGYTTHQSYTGMVTITVSGTGQVAAKFYSDAFYMYADDKGQRIVPKHDKDFLSLCINGLSVDHFVQTIPVPNENHTYTFQINAPGGSLTFGICDDGVSDNTGSFTVKISQP